LYNDSWKHIKEIDYTSSPGKLTVINICTCVYSCMNFVNTIYNINNDNFVCVEYSFYFYI